jgi:hypothetical protein
MKNFLKGFVLLIICKSIVLTSYAQVGVGTTTPDNSAMLDVSAVSRGFLPPRLSQTQILAIQNPAAGLIVYNTFFNKPVYFNGTIWKFFNDSTMVIKIGDAVGGGIVFYIDGTGLHGLIAATADQSNGIGWGCYLTSISTGTAIGTGMANTNAIVAQPCGSTVTTAAKMCDTLSLNGYTDWYLPSKDELNQMYLKKSVIGGFVNSAYWSSSEAIGPDAAYYQFFTNGSQYYANKNVNTNAVRAIRSF